MADPGGGGATDGEGGGIRNAGALTVSGCTLTNNPAAPGAPVFGGGIFNDLSGTLTVIGSTLSDNFPYFQGGGILNGGDATMSIDHSTLSGNQATGVFTPSGGHVGGGGILNSGTMTVDHTSITGNHANDVGGGIFNAFGKLTLDHSTVEDNTAVNGGADIYNLHTTDSHGNDVSGTVTIKHSDVGSASGV